MSKKKYEEFENHGQSRATSKGRREGEIVGGARWSVLSGDRTLTRADVLNLLKTVDSLKKLQSEIRGDYNWSLIAFLKFLAVAFLMSQMLFLYVWILMRGPFWRTFIEFNFFATPVGLGFLIFRAVLSMTLGTEHSRENATRLFKEARSRSDRLLSEADFQARGLFEQRIELAKEIMALAESQNFETKQSLCRTKLKELLAIQEKLEDYDRELFPQNEAPRG